MGILKNIHKMPYHLRIECYFFVIWEHETSEMRYVQIYVKVLRTFTYHDASHLWRFMFPYDKKNNILFLNGKAFCVCSSKLLWVKNNYYVEVVTKLL